MSKNNVLNSIQTLLTRPGMSHTVLLTSFRQDGQGIGTPVGMMSADRRLYFMTPASTWKVRRIAHNAHITLALCTFQGKMLSSAVDAVARRLDGAEAKRARKLVCVGFSGWCIYCFYAIRYPGDKTAVYKVELQSVP